MSLSAQQPVASDSSGTPTQVLASGVAARRLVRFNGAVAPATRPQGPAVAVTFTLYRERDDTTGLWTETQNVEPNAEGRYSVLLGATQPDGLPLELFAMGEARWLGARLLLPGEIEEPRVLLVSVPYALKAADAETLGGRPLSAFMLLPEGGAAAGAAATTAAAKAAGGRGTLVATAAPVVASAVGTNYIPMFMDTGGTLGNSVIYQSGANVGVGTTGPQASLDVQLTTSTAVNAINSFLTLANSSPITGSVVSAMNMTLLDKSTAANLSKQSVRMVYIRDAAASGAVNAFDSIFTTTAFLYGNAPYQLRAMNIEGPTVDTGKTLNTFYGAYIGSPGGGGAVTNRYALVTEPNAGSVGIGTTAPAGKLDVALATGTAQNAINANLTLNNSAPVTDVVTAMNMNLVDVSTASNLSKQAVRMLYLRDVGATGTVSAFDSILTTAAWLRADAPFQLRGMSIEGPTVDSGKTLGTFYGAYIGSPGGGGAVSNKYALVTEANAGNVGIGTTAPTQKLEVAGNVQVSAGGVISGNGSGLTNLNASSIASGTIANALTTATATNTASTIVARDASGNFAAGAVTVGSLTASGAVSGNQLTITGQGNGITFPDNSSQTSACNVTAMALAAVASVTKDQLGTAGAGRVQWCTDCQPGSDPCGDGSGAWAFSVKFSGTFHWACKF